MNLKDLIPDLLKIARQAGDAILDIYRREEDFGIEIKSDKSPLTIADKAANELICRGLAALPMQYPIISEENKLLDYEERRHWERCWLVDPLDGTKEFIKRNGDFTVNIALVENGRVILGIVHCPVADELCWAMKGEGAFLIKNKLPQVLEVQTFNEAEEGLNIICSRSHLNSETQAFIDRYKNPNLVSRGSSLKFLMLAKGEAHLYPRIAPTMEWDTAAAHIIVEEAGGSVVDFNSGETLTYNKADLRNPAFIAAGRRERNRSGF